MPLECCFFHSEYCRPGHLFSGSCFDASRRSRWYPALSCFSCADVGFRGQGSGMVLVQSRGGGVIQHDSITTTHSLTHTLTNTYAHTHIHTLMHAFTCASRQHAVTALCAMFKSS